MENWDQDTIEHIEEFKLMLMTRSNKVLGIASISKGGINGTVTDVRIILQYAIKGPHMISSNKFYIIEA